VGNELSEYIVRKKFSGKKGYRGMNQVMWEEILYMHQGENDGGFRDKLCQKVGEVSGENLRYKQVMERYLQYDREYGVYYINDKTGVFYDQFFIKGDKDSEL